jgi:hypothetical protein
VFALARQVGTHFTIKSIKSEDQLQQLRDEEEEVRLLRAKKRSLRFAVVWARFVGRLTGLGGWNLALAVKLDESRKRQEYEQSMAWLDELLQREKAEEELERRASIIMNRRDSTRRRASGLSRRLSRIWSYEEQIASLAELRQRAIDLKKAEAEKVRPPTCRAPTRRIPTIVPSLWVGGAREAAAPGTPSQPAVQGHEARVAAGGSASLTRPLWP